MTTSTKLILIGWAFILMGCFVSIQEDRRETELTENEPNYYRGCVASAYQSSRWDADIDDQLAECEVLYGKKNI